MITNTSSATKCGLFLLFCALSSCDAPHRVQILDELNGGISQKEFLNIEKEKGVATLVESDSLPKNDPRPPYSHDIYEINGYKLFGETGTIHAKFFNDKLYSVTFYPNDAGRFQMALDQKYHVSILKGKSWRRSANVLIHHDVNYLKREYFSFEDIDIQGEYDDWISKYS